MSIATRHLELIDDCKRDIVEGAPGGLTLHFDKEGTPGHPFVTSVDIYQNGETFTMVVNYRKDKPEAKLADVFPVEEGTEDKLAEFRFLEGLKGMPLDCVAVLVAGIYQEAYDVEMEAKLQALIETGEITLYSTMCEPGYHCSAALANPEAFKGYLAANWNNIDKALGDWLEEESDYESGFWSDEWTACIECDGLVRIQPDSYSWRLYGKNTDCGTVCGDCLKKDIPAYLEELEGQSSKGITIEIDPAQHGYVKVNDSQFENGWHPGQNDDPGTMSKTLRLNGVHRFLWDISGVGQFDVRFDLYLHEEIKDDLTRVRELLGLK